MTTAKKLEKVFILTSDFPHTEEKKLEKEIAMVKAEIDNPTYVPGLNPATAAVQSKITAVTDPSTGYIVQRHTARALEKTLTGKINDAIEAVQDIITRQWMPQAEAALKSDPDKINKAKTLGFGVKTVDTGHVDIITAKTKAAATESTPVIVAADINVHGQHTLTIHDSHTKKAKLRVDVLRIDVYGVTSDTVPAGLSDLIAKGGGYLGQAGKLGKFVHTYTTVAGSKQTEQYIAVYVGKATKKPIAESPVKSAFMN